MRQSQIQMMYRSLKISGFLQRIKQQCQFLHCRWKVELRAESILKDLTRFWGIEAYRDNYFAFNDCLLKRLHTVGASKRRKLGTYISIVSFLKQLTESFQIKKFRSKTGRLSSQKHTFNYMTEAFQLALRVTHHKYLADLDQ